MGVPFGEAVSKGGMNHPLREGRPACPRGLPIPDRFWLFGSGSVQPKSAYGRFSDPFASFSVRVEITPVVVSPHRGSTCRPMKHRAMPLAGSAGAQTHHRQNGWNLAPIVPPCAHIVADDIIYSGERRRVSVLARHAGHIGAGTVVGVPSAGVFGDEVNGRCRKACWRNIMLRARETRFERVAVRANTHFGEWGAGDS
jgi:hypothetical protein